MEDFPKPPVPLRERLRLPVSLRARLIAANVLITAIAVAALGYYVYYRGQESTAFLTNELDTSLRDKAFDTLRTTGESQSAALNGVFATFREDITQIGFTTNTLLAREDMLANSTYWDAAQSLSRLPNGSWDNPSKAEPASVFVPARQELVGSLAAELNTLKQLDFVAPSILRTDPDVVAIYFGGPSGETLYYPDVDLANLVPPDFDVTKRPWYVAAGPSENPARKAVWSVPYLDAARNGLVITTSFPIYESMHGFRGVVAMDIQLKRLSSLVSAIKIGDTGYAFVVDKDGRLIAMPQSGYNDLGYSQEIMPLGETLQADKFPKAFPPALLEAIDKMRAGRSGLETIRVNGQDRYIIYYPVPEVGYSMAIIVPTQEMLASAAAARQQVSMSATNTQQITFVIVALILAFALLSTLAIGNTLISPLVSLTATAEEITRGNLDARARVQGRDEIATLANTLNSMTARLRGLIQSLERRVRDRTAALEEASATASRRAAQFEAITQVTRAISSIRNMDELMPIVAAVISQYFDFYHVGIFLNDENHESTWLIAANSEGGRRMLKRHHNLKIGQQGIVGYVAAHGESRVARSVGEDAVFFNNPDLPDTKSEAALPLRRGPQIAGVLDVQSTKEDAFTADDLSILAILADQVSLAMENTRLFETTRRSLMETETLYRQYVQEAWNRLPQEGQVTGYRYTPRGVTALPAAEIPVSAAPASADEDESLTVPIKLRGEIIGNLVVQSHKSGSWTQDQVQLVQAVADRVALSAENARLFDETNRRAERERLVTEITSRIRSSNDPDEMIRTAVEELRNALGATEIEVIPQVVPTAAHGQTRTTAAPFREASEAPQRGNGAKK